MVGSEIKAVAAEGKGEWPSKEGPSKLAIDARLANSRTTSPVLAESPPSSKSSSPDANTGLVRGEATGSVTWLRHDLFPGDGEGDARGWPVTTRDLADPGDFFDPGEGAGVKARPGEGVRRASICAPETTRMRGDSERSCRLPVFTSRAEGEATASWARAGDDFLKTADNEAGLKRRAANVDGAPVAETG